MPQQETIKNIRKYGDKWVALSDKKVIASGDTLLEVKAKVEKKKIKNFVFHLVSTKPLAMYED